MKQIEEVLYKMLPKFTHAVQQYKKKPEEKERTPNNKRAVQEVQEEKKETLTLKEEIKENAIDIHQCLEKVLQHQFNLEATYQSPLETNQEVQKQEEEHEALRLEREKTQKSIKEKKREFTDQIGKEKSEAETERKKQLEIMMGNILNNVHKELLYEFRCIADEEVVKFAEKMVDFYD